MFWTPWQEVAQGVTLETAVSLETTKAIQGQVVVVEAAEAITVLLLVVVVAVVVVLAYTGRVPMGHPTVAAVAAVKRAEIGTAVEAATMVAEVVVRMAHPGQQAMALSESSGPETFASSHQHAQQMNKEQK